MISASTPSDLAKVAGTARAPLLIDVRREEIFKAANDMIAGAIRRSPDAIEQWQSDLPDRKPVVVYCVHGAQVSQGVCLALGNKRVGVSYLAGGIAAWADQKLPIRRKLENEEHAPSKWVTRERPKIDRIACPWLIRRFIDPQAAFLFVKPSEVLGVADRFGATPFDVEGVHWGHRGEACTFDAMVEEFGLATPALSRLAAIVRAADTARLDLAPEAAG